MKSLAEEYRTMDDRRVRSARRHYGRLTMNIGTDDDADWYEVWGTLRDLPLYLFWAEFISSNLEVDK